MNSDLIYMSKEFTGTISFASNLRYKGKKATTFLKKSYFKRLLMAMDFLKTCNFQGDIFSLKFLVN